MTIVNVFRPRNVAAVLLLFLLIYSCKKEGADTPKPVVNPPVQVDPDTDSQQGSFIRIPYTNPLDSASYYATLGSMDIQVLNSGDTALLLAMPAGMDTGVVTLHVPGLDQFEYHIQVKAAPPVPDVEAAYTAIADNIAAIAASIDQLGAGISPVGYEGFRGYLEGLSAAGKAQVVRYFRAIQQSQPGNEAIYKPSVEPQRRQYQWMGMPGIPYAATPMTVQPEVDLAVQYILPAFQFSHYASYALLAPPESPEKFFITYISRLYGQLASFYFGRLLKSTPVIDEVRFSPQPFNSITDTGPRPDDYPVFRAGVPFPIYASLVRRPITLADRPQADSEVVPGLIHAVFDAYGRMEESVAYVNTAMGQLTTFPVVADIPPLADMVLPTVAPDSAYLWEPMPVQWLAESFNFQDTLGRFKMKEQLAEPGMVALNVGYAGDFRAAYREVYRTAMWFAYSDEFNSLARQLPIRIQAPDPDSITVTTVDDTPARFTLPYGRMKLQLEATVHPAEAPQDVAWSVREGYELATVAQDGRVYSSFFSNHDTTGYGYSTVRAWFKEDAHVYAEFKVKTTSYRIKYVSGAGQSFLGGIPYPIRVSVQDRLDGSILSYPVPWGGSDGEDIAGEKLRLRCFALNAQFHEGNDMFYSSWGNDDFIPDNILSATPFFPHRGIEPYNVPIWVYLYQDGHAIDSLAISAYITDYVPQ